MGSTLRTTVFAAALLLLCVLASTVNSYYVFVLGNVALLAIVGIGLNILLGLTGQVSFGHAGFYAIGAYVVAVFTTRWGVSFWLAWPLAMLFAGGMGALLALPALRAKGPYLAMITIAFGFVVEHSIVELAEVTGGQNGIMGIPAPRFGTFGQSERVMTLIAVLSMGALLACYALLARGTWGVAMRAVRDSATAAESIGLDTLRIKTVAFALSALCAGAAGGLFAPLSGFVTPQTFGLGQSIQIVLVVMIGGKGSTSGPLIGAVIVGLLPELLAGLAEYRLLFFGALLLAVLWLAPDGVAGLLKRTWRKFWQRVMPENEIPPTHVEPVLSARTRHRLDVQGMTMQFAGLRAVDDVSFVARAGCITSVIGPNGAGKTTVLNMLSGFYRPTQGRFGLDEHVLTGATAMRIARAGIARTYQTSQLFASVSVEDNVSLALRRGRIGPLLGRAQLHAPRQRRRARALLAWCGYAGRYDVRAADLPHVDRRLVEIARAVAMDPDVLLLDEPAAGLSQEDKRHLALLLRRLAAAGLCVVLVEHDMGLVMQVSDHIVVLNAGQLLAAGTPAEIQADARVQQAYLGESLTENINRRPTNTGPVILHGSNLTVGYGAAPVLHDVNLQVGRGEVVVVLGANGAGKSTLMRALAGLHRPIHGAIELAGHDLSLMGAEQVVAQGMVLVAEGRQLFPESTVLDNMCLGAFLQPGERATRVEEMLVRFPPLRSRLRQRAGLLSGGEQQMLAIARALMARPRILLLDEPSLGLAPKLIHELFATLEGLRAEGITLLVVDQMAMLALELADRAYVMANGRIVAHGSADEIAADAALRRAYLGSAN